MVGFNNASGIVTGYATGRVSGNGRIGGLVGQNGGMVNGYWDIGSTGRMSGFGTNPGSNFNGVGISSITNVVYASGAGTYTDNKGTAATTGDDVEVFNNMAFTNSFTLPGASETWPTLKAEDSFLQP